MPKNILLVTANPLDTTRLRVDEEIREIQTGLKLSQQPGGILLHSQLAARPVDIRRAMLAHKPAIVHFSGHGEGDAGLVFEDSAGNAAPVSAEALARFFELFAVHVQCVVLNACYSEVQADAIAEHINYVVGMNQAIDDRAAIEFAVAFYDALGAGESIEFAYQLACNAIQFAGISEQHTPVLKKRRQKPVVTAQAYETFDDFTVFLAEVSDDLQGRRQEIKSYLEQHNVRVLPQDMYYFPAVEPLQEAIQTDLRQATLFVQLLSIATPQRPPGMSTPQLQYKLAVADPRLPILQWRDPDLIPDPVQCPLSALPTVMAAELGEFKHYIKNRLVTLADEKRRAAEKPPPLESSDQFVFINAAPEDEALADKIEIFLQEKGVFSSLPIPGDELPAMEKLQDLQDNLVDSDTVIVVYHNASVRWVREQLRWCRKVLGKRKRPYKLIALCQDLPPGQKKIGMTLPNLHIFYCPDPQAATCLPKLIKALQS
ncbi:MAG: CHAT domain-containing protein [Gammaproteobacteria bacterium]|nr:CHAT domain-containing protein [Gammaproteobacteria bacterium]